MNRGIAQALAVAVAGAGLAWGQSGQSGDSSPPPSVIRVGPVNRPAYGTKAAPKPSDDAKPASNDKDDKPADDEKPPKKDSDDNAKPKEPAKSKEPEKPKTKPAEKPNTVEPPKLAKPADPLPKTVIPSGEKPPKDKSIIRSSASSQVMPPGNAAIGVPEAQATPNLAPPQPPRPLGQQARDDKTNTAASTPAARPSGDTGALGETAPAAQNMPTPPPIDISSTYPTFLIEPVLPWTKCGKRCCGTVYIDTPYFWLNTEYLFGWLKTDHTQVLVTSGPPDAAKPGALDDPQTTVLFNGERLHEQPFFGGRFVFGAWFDECQYCGGEGGFFFYGSQDKGFIAGANGFPGLDGLYQPFFNPLQGGFEDAFIVAQQGDRGPSSGVININSRSRVLGADGHALFSFCRGATWRTDAICGVRWLGLDEDLTIEESTKSPQTFDDPRFASDVSVHDKFTTRTDFVGADVGFKSHIQKSCYSLDLLARVAVGGNHQRIRNEGLTTYASTGLNGLAVVQGGRFVGEANSGQFTNDVFSVVPEVGLNLSYQPTHWFRFTVGYSWMYWTNVVRAGDQLDRVVNPIGVPTRPEYRSDIYEPRRPGVAFNQTDIWLQMATVGMQFMY